MLWACSLLIAGCKGSPPTKDEIVGTWISASQEASITFEPSGAFSSKDLPAEFFWGTSHAGKKLSGTGIWKITEENGEWVVQLSFMFTSLPDLQTFTTTALLSGDKSYIYVWEEEEGGQRYKFKKKTGL